MITSTDNRQIKNLGALLKKPRERSRQQEFVVEGPRMCFEAPREQVKAIYVSEGFLSDAEAAEQLFSYCAGISPVLSYEVVSDAVFRSVSDTQNPKGVMAVVKMPHYAFSDLLGAECPLLLVLEGVQDPGNLGTMLRTGEGAGMTGILMDRTTADLFNPKTIRSTMGSIYRVPFFVAQEFPEALALLKDGGIKLYAAHLDGERAYDEPDYTEPCAFLIGNEGRGLTKETAGTADERIRIPMEGQVESLNAAVSASVLLYECNRQRRGRQGL